MDAAFLIAAGKYELRSLPDPIAPPDGLILDVKACGVCGSDLRRWREGPPPGADGILAGHELAGVVLETGAYLTRFKAGDRLAIAPDVHCGHCYYCQRGRYNLCDNLRLVGISAGYPGGFAQKMMVSAEILENGVVHRVPDGLSFADAALAEPASSVLAAHDRAGTDLESTVVVLGGGPIGCLHIAVAHARGAAVILSEPSLERRQIAAGFAPEMIVDPLQEDLNERVRAYTHGLGADIVICANPIAATQAQAVEIVRKGGRVVLFGGLPKADPLTHLDGNRIHYGEIEVVGSFSYHPRFHALALDAICRKLIPAEKLITHNYPLGAINQAFEMASSGKALKVMVEMH
jgi:L-iditol 2-dehydrogenase